MADEDLLPGAVTREHFGQQTFDRRGEHPGIGGGEDVDAVLDGGDELRPGCRPARDEVVGVEDRPVGVADLGMGLGGHLGQNIAGAMDQAALPQRAGQGGLGGVDQPGRAIGDNQQRWAQPPRAQFVEEIAPGIGGLGTPGGQRDEHRRPVGGDAPRGQHRFGAGTGVHPEH